MQSIFKFADEQGDNQLFMNYETVSDIAGYAADEIVELMETEAQKQWNAEFQLAHS